MIKYLIKKQLKKFEKRYNYDTNFMQDILTADLVGFLKFTGFQSMAAHQNNVPTEALFSARIRSTLWEDCGSCTQLLVDMARENNVSDQTIHAILSNHTRKLSEDTALVVKFTNLVLSHSSDANDLRAQIENKWGKQGLVTISYAISCYRVYPSLKHALGYGLSCSKVLVNNESITPTKACKPSIEGSQHAVI